MIWAILGAFFAGFFMVFCVSYQTRQLSQGASKWRIFAISVAISTIWATVIRFIVLMPVTIPFYVLGAGLGTLTSLGVKVNGKRHGE